MVTKEGSSKIENYITPRKRAFVLEHGLINHIVI